MEKDTTQSTGVSEEKVTDNVTPEASAAAEDLDNVPALEVEPTLSQRDETINDIAAKARENRSKEEGYFTDEGTDPDGANSEAGAAEQAAPEKEENPIIKVDGEEIPVTQAEIDEAGGVSALQKERAAANRLRQAAEATAESNKREASLAERERKIAEREAQLASQTQTPAAQQDPNTQQPSDTDADADLEATAKDLATKIYSGEEDQAEEAILSILQRKEANGQPTTNIDTESLKAEVKWGIEQDLGNEEFAEKYPRLNSNPTLLKLVNEETKKIVREHPEYGPRKIILDAAKAVTKQFEAELAGEKSDNAADDERMNRKKSMDSVNGANTRMPGAEEKQPLSRSQIVAQMGQSRTGQQN